MHVRILVAALTVGAAGLFAASALAAASQSPHPFVDSTYVEPLTSSSACLDDQQRRSACRVVRNFFRAVNSREFGKACGLLGKRLRSPWHGVTCRASLDGMVVEPVPWGILEADIAGPGVSVLLIVGQHELERIWMRRHRAYVDREEGHLRILATRLVA